MSVSHTVFNGETYYKANDIAYALGYVNFKKAAGVHIPSHLLYQGADIKAGGDGNERRARYTTSAGVTFLVYQSRLPNSIQIAESLGIPLSPWFKAYYHEMSALRCLLKAFKGHIMERQFRVGKYFIDMYFPKYRIAVECDKLDHTQYDKDLEAARTLYISEKLRCSWVPFNPDAADYDILDVINKIHKLIVNSDSANKLCPAC